MELKLFRTWLTSLRTSLLLIEPYGIEIWSLNDEGKKYYKLLIEPYGIEIRSWHHASYWSSNTFNRTLWNWNYDDCKQCPVLQYSFNRTLWNWNNLGWLVWQAGNETFNRTLWNWNLLKLLPDFRFLLLLIEPYGIEMIVSL